MADLQGYLIGKIGELQNLPLDGIKEIVKKDIGAKFFTSTNNFVINFNQGLTVADKYIVKLASSADPKINNIIDTLKPLILSVLFYFPVVGNAKDLNYFAKISDLLGNYSGFVELLKSFNLTYISYMTNPDALAKFLTSILPEITPIINNKELINSINTFSVSTNFVQILPIYFTYLVIKRQANNCLISRNILPSNLHSYINKHLENATKSLNAHHKQFVDTANKLKGQIVTAKNNFYVSYQNYLKKAKAHLGKLHEHLSNVARTARNSIKPFKNQSNKKAIELQEINSPKKIEK